MWSTKDGQLLHEMRRGVRGAEGGSGGDDKAAHDGGVGSLCPVGEAWLRVADLTERSVCGARRTGSCCMR